MITGDSFAMTYMATNKANFREAAEAMISAWTNMIKSKKV